MHVPHDVNHDFNVCTATRQCSPETDRPRRPALWQSVWVAAIRARNCLPRATLVAIIPGESSMLRIRTLCLGAAASVAVGVWTTPLSLAQSPAANPFAAP